MMVRTLIPSVGRALSADEADAIAIAICHAHHATCLLYTSDAADERSSVDLGGRRIIKKKNIQKYDGDIRVMIEKRDVQT